jgi:hypothetical protein
MPFQTERQFSLPKGFLDDEGALHRQGTIRLATAADEILPLKDQRVQQNPAYLSVLVLSRVVTKLGELPSVTPKVIEGLYASDLAYLQTIYEEMNGGGGLTADAVCPKCEHTFEVTLDPAVEA